MNVTIRHQSSPYASISPLRTQAERLARRRNDEVAAVRRAAVESLRKERAQWVAVSALERGRRGGLDCFTVLLLLDFSTMETHIQNCESPQANNLHEDVAVLK